jgi:hypothetical protein
MLDFNRIADYYSAVAAADDEPSEPTTSARHPLARRRQWWTGRTHTSGAASDRSRKISIRRRLGLVLTTLLGLGAGTFVLTPAASAQVLPPEPNYVPQSTNPTVVLHSSPLWLFAVVAIAAAVLTLIAVIGYARRSNRSALMTTPDAHDRWLAR